MPIGNKSGQPGGAAPLLGECEIRGQSSGEDIMTITGPSSMTSNKYLNLRTYVGEGSTAPAGDQWWLSSAGNISNGFLYKSTTLSSGSTTVTLSASHVGQIIYFLGANNSYTITLPDVVAGGWLMGVSIGDKSSNADTWSKTGAIFKTNAAANTIKMSTPGDGYGVVWEWLSDGTYWYPIVHTFGATGAAAGTT